MKFRWPAGPGGALPVMLLVAAASLFFSTLGRHGDWEAIEGRYLAAALEILRDGRWIPPYPPMMPWLTAASLAVLGPHPFAARLWPALFGVLTVGLVYLLGRHWRNERAGLLAGGVLASFAGYFALTQVLTLVMGMTFWTTLSLYAAARFLLERRLKPLRSWMIVLAAALAGGFLTVGLSAIVLPLAALALALTITRLWPLLSRLPWRAPLVLLAAAVVPWVVAAAVADPQFLSRFFLQEPAWRLQAFSEGFLPGLALSAGVLLAGLLPWIVFLPALVRPWFSGGGAGLRRDAVAALLVSWVALVLAHGLLFHGGFSTRLAAMLPAMALLLADRFDEVFDEAALPNWLAAGLGVLVALLAGGLFLLKWPGALPGPVLVESIRVAGRNGPLALVLAFGVFSLVGVWGMRRPALAFGAVLVLQVLLLTHLVALAARAVSFYG